jgi:hypothetical protein
MQATPNMEPSIHGKGMCKKFATSAPTKAANTVVNDRKTRPGVMVGSWLGMLDVCFQCYIKASYF